MCNGRMCEKATQKINIVGYDAWVRPPCWPTSIDDAIKEIKVQRLMGPGPDGPLCESCGIRVMRYKTIPDTPDFAEGHQYTYDRYCVSCRGKK